jgi:hypothetical protein
MMRRKELTVEISGSLHRVAAEPLQRLERIYVTTL